jgi:hypothetical protein
MSGVSRVAARVVVGHGQSGSKVAVDEMQATSVSRPHVQMQDVDRELGISASPHSRFAPSVSGKATSSSTASGDRASHTGPIMLGRLATVFSASRARLSVTIHSVKQKRSDLMGLQRIEVQLERLEDFSGLQEVRSCIVDLCKILYGEASLEHITAWEALGEAQQGAGDLERAALTYEGVISLAGTLPDVPTSVLASALEHLGVTLWRQHRGEKSLDLLQRSVDLKSADHAEVARLMCLMGRMCGGTSRSIELFSGAVEAGGKAWGHDNASTAQIYFWLASELERQGDLERAAGCWSKSFEIQRACYGEHDMRLMDTLKACANVAALAGDMDKAEEWAKIMAAQEGGDGVVNADLPWIETKPDSPAISSTPSLSG